MKFVSHILTGVAPLNARPQHAKAKGQRQPPKQSKVIGGEEGGRVVLLGEWILF
jgi:hypothetical protein